MKSISIGIVWAAIFSAFWAQTPSPGNYKIDPARSRIELTVSKTGLLKIIGHDHSIVAKSYSGQVRFNSGNIRDSSVQLNIDARSLFVLADPSVSEKDRQQIQSNMESLKVLNTGEFPWIMFHSTEVGRSAGEGLLLRGRLNLHGAEKEIAFPVQVHPEINHLRVTGTAVITQTDFGIKPIKVAAGGLKVKDQIHVTFDIFAEKADQ